MDIYSFLDKTTGDWFSQRTVYTLTDNQVDNSKANLTVDLLSQSDVKELSQQHNLNQELSLGGINTHWDNSPDWGKPKQQGNSLLFIFQNEDNIHRGKIIKLLKDNDTITGEYVFAEDKSITFRMEKDSQYIEERIWFASDNLRFRTNIVRFKNYVTETSFYSEIRRIR